ncbi:MAG TPA: hypothetical protein VH743_13370 [Beijerinckiaceae bacterium]|jgi:hypothetical protein
MTGSELLQEIATFWKVDRAHIRWREDGFDWWPGSYVVRVRTFPPRMNHADARWRLTVETELARSAPIDAESLADELSYATPAMTPAYSLVYAPHGSTKDVSEGASGLKFFNSAYVNSEMLSVTRLFARLALLQVINAELLGDHLAKEFGAEPAFVGAGRAQERAPVVDVALSIYLDEGAKPSQWSNVSEFAAFVERYAQSESCVGRADKASMMLETPFGEDTAIVQLRSNQPHEYLGSGLLVTLELPEIASGDDAAEEAALLNNLEASSWTDFPQLGCWHTFETENEVDALVHSSFVPNALYGNLVASNLAMWSLNRAQWVRATRRPDLKDKAMSEIIQQRLRSGVPH